MEAKKNPKLDLQKRRGLFFNIGLVLSMLLVISAFEWKTEEATSIVTIDKSDPGEPPFMPPVTVIPPKTRPVVLVNLVSQKEEVVKEQPDHLDLDKLFSPDEPMLEMPPLDEPTVEPTPTEPVWIVESMPKFNGGEKEEFLKFVLKQLVYPSKARRMDIQGMVVVQFVIDETGAVTDVELVRGIGGGCDEEAIRAIQNSPKWTPGKQRGVPVKVRMALPITFRLS